MAAATENATSMQRQRPKRWGLGPWSILIFLSACFAVLSGCAETRQAPLARPRLQLTEALRTGSLCDGLRGRLPVAEAVDVNAMADGWEGAEAWGMCQYDRAQRIVGVADAFEAAWARYEDAR